MSTPQFKVGDKVTLVRRRRYSDGKDLETETVVTKVGRKYFWVEHGLHYQKFHLDSGLEVSNFSASCYVTTPERQAEAARREELETELRKHGIQLDHKARKLGSETLTVILNAVTEGGA